MVNGRGLSLDELTVRLARVSRFYPGQPVILRAGGALPYERLVKVIDTCRAADVWNFSLSTCGETEPR